MGRYRWDGSSLVEGQGLRVFGSAEARQSNGPNHSGGPLVLGADGLLYLASGFNSGWCALKGPDGRDPQQAPSDLVVLPGASYGDPELSFQVPIGITSIGFLSGSVLGPGYDDGVLTGNGRFDNARVYLLRLNPARDGLVLAGALADGVADSGETDGLVFGTDFGVVTDIQVGADGAVYITSLSQGTVYRLAPVPVPASVAPLGAALAPLGWYRRRRSPASSGSPGTGRAGRTPA